MWSACRRTCRASSSAPGRAEQKPGPCFLAASAPAHSCDAPPARRRRRGFPYVNIPINLLVLTAPVPVRVFVGECHPLAPSPLRNKEMKLVLKFTFAVLTLRLRRLAPPSLLSLLLVFSTTLPPRLLSRAPHHLCACFKGCCWNRLFHHWVSLFLAAWHLAQVNPPQVVTLISTRERAQKVQSKAIIGVKSIVPVGKDL